ncbi:MAG: hypothetical protein ACE5SW_11220, partial [Nitrososphaeraceae archaeon]
GRIYLISLHKSSGILVIVLTYFLLFSIIGYDRRETSYIPIYFWDRLLVYCMILLDVCSIIS